MTSTVIVIPSLEPDGKLIGLLHSIRSKDSTTPILIVDDGSGLGYCQLFKQAEAIFHCQVVYHESNKGKGAALKTAMTTVLAMYPEAQWMVTIDSDGQHSYEDMSQSLVLATQHPQALILGTRHFDKDVPFRSKFGNIITRNILRLVTGINVEDTQTGLRVIPTSFIPSLLLVEGERFEYETNMLIETKKRHWPIYCQPISTIYIEDNASSHFRIIADSLSIYSVVIKYILSSITSFLVDIGTYALLLQLLNQLNLSSIFIASLGARGVSSLFNYYVNRELVFAKDTHQSMVKYYMLVVCQILLSATLVYGIHRLFRLSEVIGVKIVIDSLLFILSYYVQKNYIFTEDQ